MAFSAFPPPVKIYRSRLEIFLSTPEVWIIFLRLGSNRSEDFFGNQTIAKLLGFFPDLIEGDRPLPSRFLTL